VKQPPELVTTPGVVVPASGGLGADGCPAEDKVESGAEEAGQARRGPESRWGRARAGSET